MKDNSSSEINNQSEQYRRGQILGFTMAEIMLVLLFILLLLLGSKIKQLNKNLDASYQPGSLEFQAVELMDKKLVELKGKSLVEQSKDILWLTETLVLNSENVISNSAKSNQELLKENQELTQKLSEAKIVISELSKADDPEAVSSLITVMKNSQLSALEAKQCLIDCGEGPKACWGESIRNPDYIYNVGIYDEHLYVTPNLDNAAKHLSDWNSLDSDARIAVPSMLSISEFRMRFEKLKAHAIANDCVYHVRLIDVDSANKFIYKSQRRLVEDSVYISIRPNWNEELYGKFP